MMFRTLLFFVLCLSFACLQAQNPCRSTARLAKVLADGQYVTGSRIQTGLATRMVIDSQYVRFEELQRCASAGELAQLIRSDSNVLALFAWQAYLLVQPAQALQFMYAYKDRLRTRWANHFLNHCQGSVKTRMLDFMERDAYEKLVSEKIELSAREIVVFLQFKEMREKERVRLKEYGEGF